MNHDEFHNLALRVAEGTATEAERHHFEKSLAEQPERRDAWLALRRELEQARDAMTDAADLAGPPETMPEQVRAQVQAEAKPVVQFPTWARWLAGGLAAAACLAVTLWLRDAGERRGAATGSEAPRLAFVVPGGSPVTIEAHGRSVVTELPYPLIGDELLRVTEGHESLLLRADGTMTTIRGTYAARELTTPPGEAARPWFALPLAVLEALPAVMRGSDGIRILSPRGATASPEPLLAWASEPGETYDVALRDALRPELTPARLAGVVPPLEFRRLGVEPLKPGGIYLLEVAVSGRPVSAVSGRFLVVPPSGEPALDGDPAATIAAAFSALVESPARSGDAWALLQKVPDDWRHSELGRRLAAAATAP